MLSCIWVSQTKMIKIHLLVLWLFFVLGLGGCSVVSKKEAAAEALSMEQKLQLQREIELQSRWRGKPYDELLKTSGPPKLMMNVLGYRPLRTSLLVYGVVDEASSCIDAFTMVKDEETAQWTVSDYFCR